MLCDGHQGTKELSTIACRLTVFKCALSGGNPRAHQWLIEDDNRWRAHGAAVGVGASPSTVDRRRRRLASARRRGRGWSEPINGGSKTTPAGERTAPRSGLE